MDFDGGLRERYVDAMHDHAHRRTRSLALLAYSNQVGAHGVGEDEPAALLASTVFVAMASTALFTDAGHTQIAGEVHDAGVQASKSIIAAYRSPE